MTIRSARPADHSDAIDQLNRCSNCGRLAVPMDRHVKKSVYPAALCARCAALALCRMATVLYGPNMSLDPESSKHPGHNARLLAHSIRIPSDKKGSAAGLAPDQLLRAQFSRGPMTRPVPAPEEAVL